MKKYKEEMSELLQLQTTTEQKDTNHNNSTSTPQNTQLVEREKVEGSGFEIVGNNDHGYFIALGQYRLTTSKTTKTECIEMIEKRDYELLLGLIGAAIETTIPRIENIIHNTIDFKNANSDQNYMNNR